MVLVIGINEGVEMGSSEVGGWGNIKRGVVYGDVLLVFWCLL